MKKFIKRAKSVDFNKTEPLKNKQADEDLWNEFSAKITPLKCQNRFIDISAEVSSLKTEPRTNLKKKLRTLTTQENLYNTLPSNYSHGFASGLDKQSSRKMRRGKINIQARLDLHGMKKKEAYTSLLDFLELAYEVGRRSVLVITGKGLSLNGEIGVLRQAVPKWLNE